jgi:hypothetical protein
LIAKWLNMAAPCQRRLLAAEILATRALDEATRSALEKHRPFETSRAVLELLDRALAR